MQYHKLKSAEMLLDEGRRQRTSKNNAGNATSFTITVTSASKCRLETCLGSENLQLGVQTGSDTMKPTVEVLAAVQETFCYGCEQRFSSAKISSQHNCKPSRNMAENNTTKKGHKTGILRKVCSTKKNETTSLYRVRTEAALGDTRFLGNTTEIAEQNDTQKQLLEETNEIAHDPLELFPTSKAFRNPLILLKILQTMRTNDLLSCRLVNIEWSELSSELLLKQNALKVSLVKLKGSSGFVLLTNSELALNNLTTLLVTSTRFPSYCFSFDGQLHCPDAKEFFRLHGNMVKWIMLKGHMDYNFTLNMLIKLPNLTTVFLDRSRHYHDDFMNFHPNHPVIFDHHPPVSSVTSIIVQCFRYNTCMLTELIESSPKLNSCTGHWGVDTAMLLINQIDVLKELRLYPLDSEMPDTKHLAEKNLKLEKLQMDFRSLSQEACHELQASITKILESSKSTLQVVEFVLWDKLPFVIPWLQLRQLSELQIDVDIQSSIASDKLIQLSENNFPNLHTVRINSCWSSKTWYQFPLKGSAPSVRSLTINGPFEISIEMLEMFPELEHLRIAHLPNFQETGKIIWQMTTLNSLELSLKSDDNITGLEVDQVFTGFSEGTVLCLYEICDGTTPVNFKPEDKRANPSIVDLKGLRELRFVNAFCKNSEKWYGFNEFGIPQLSKQWAVDMIPNLRLVENVD